MRVVSYTRAISYRLKDENPSNIIGLQNEHIQQYIKEKDWKLAAKYSDRKFSSEEMTAFNQMLEAGLAREFDCVVMDSIFRFGHKPDRCSQRSAGNILSNRNPFCRCPR